MKKILIILSIAVLIFSSCGGDKKDADKVAAETDGTAEMADGAAEMADGAAEGTDKAADGEVNGSKQKGDEYKGAGAMLAARQKKREADAARRLKQQEAADRRRKLKNRKIVTVIFDGRYVKFGEEEKIDGLNEWYKIVRRADQIVLLENAMKIVHKDSNPPVSSNNIWKFAKHFKQKEQKPVTEIKDFPQLWAKEALVEEEFVEE